MVIVAGGGRKSRSSSTSANTWCRSRRSTGLRIRECKAWVSGFKGPASVSEDSLGPMAAGHRRSRAGPQDQNVKNPASLEHHAAIR